MKNNKNVQNNQNKSENEPEISKPKIARSRVERRWKTGLTSEQIENHVNVRINRDIRMYRPLIVATAIRYSEMGWSVIPISHKTKVPCDK